MSPVRRECRQDPRRRLAGPTLRTALANFLGRLGDDPRAAPTGLPELGRRTPRGGSETRRGAALRRASRRPAFSSTLASSPTNWPISRTTSARGRLTASARRRTMALPMIRPSATGASWRDLVRAADPEPDADGQWRLGPQPADGLDQLRGQALPLAGDPGDRDVVDEPGRRSGDLDGTLTGGRRGDELDQLEVAPGGLLQQGPGFLDRAGRGRSGRRTRRSPRR